MSGYHRSAPSHILRCAKSAETSDQLAKQMKASPGRADTAAPSGSDETSTIRLVIRAEIVREENLPTTTPRSNGRIYALGVGAIALFAALGWFGMSVFTDDSTSTTASESARNIELQSPASAPITVAPAVTAEASPKLTPSNSVATSPASASGDASITEAKSVQSAALSQRDASPTPINEVMPNVSRTALQTIRGTVRVLVRATIDRQGSVTAVASEIPGPSRYFERLSLAAARKWTFSPAHSDAPRSVLIRFDFTRDGTTARTQPVR
jgi:TonB family protein